MRRVQVSSLKMLLPARGNPQACGVTGSGGETHRLLPEPSQASRIQCVLDADDLCECRKAKRRCFLVGEAGSGCVACKTASIACTFEAPASKRKAPPANRPSATSPPGGAAVPGPSTQPPPPPAPLVSPALSVLFNTTGPSSSAVLPQSLSMHAFSSLNAYPTGPPARPFIPSFRSSFIGAGSSSSSSSEPSDPHAATPLDSAFRSNFGSASSDPHAATPLDSDPSSLFYSSESIGIT